MTTPSIAVGQEVVLLRDSTYRSRMRDVGPITATVTKVGRKYAYATKVSGSSLYKEVRFNLQDLNCVGYRVFASAPEYLEWAKRRQLQKGIKGWFNNRPYGAWDDLSLDQLEKIAEALGIETGQDVEP